MHPSHCTTVFDVSTARVIRNSLNVDKASAFTQSLEPTFLLISTLNNYVQDDLKYTTCRQCPTEKHTCATLTLLEELFEFDNITTEMSCQNNFNMLDAFLT